MTSRSKTKSDERISRLAEVYEDGRAAGICEGAAMALTDMDAPKKLERAYGKRFTDVLKARSSQ